MVAKKIKTKTARTRKTTVKKTRTAKRIVKTKAKRVIKTTKKSQTKRLYRSGNKKLLGGVCGGVAEYFDVDPTLIRLPWALASFLWGIGILLYVVAWIIVPKNPEHKWD